MPSENSASRPRIWQEEADMFLSLLNGLVPEREAVFASSEGQSVVKSRLGFVLR